MVGPFVFVALLFILAVTEKKKPEAPKQPPAQISEAELGNAIAHILVDMKKQQACK